MCFLRAFRLNNFGYLFLSPFVSKGFSTLICGINLNLVDLAHNAAFNFFIFFPILNYLLGAKSS